MAAAELPKCPYCDSPIRAGDSVHRCAVCGTLHHADCWHENGDRCCVYSCRGRAEAAPLQEETVPGVLEVGAEPVGALAPQGHDVLGEAVGFGLSLMIALLIGTLVYMRGPLPDDSSLGRHSYAPSADTREVGTSVVTLQIGDDRGEESHEVIHRTTQFDRSTKAIYLTAFINGVHMGKQVRATLTAPGGGKRGAAKVLYVELGAAGAGFPTADEKRWFKFPRPAEGWAAGKYEVRLATDDGMLGRVQVTVR